MGPDRPLRWILLRWLLLGLGIRFVLLVLAGDLVLQADEKNYLYLAASWNRFGFLNDTTRFLWPPAYPWFLSLVLDGFGFRGLFLARVVQVLLSGAIGASVMLFANRLFSRTAASIAGLLWGVHLPFIMYTHSHWAETPFLAFLLPSFYLLLAWWAKPQCSGRGQVLLAGSGLLIGLALLVKEAPLFLPVFLGILILWRSGGTGSWPAGIRNATLFILSLVVVVLPWSLRNQEIYGRFVPVGATLGENAYYGLNGLYQNFDLAPQPAARGLLTRTDLRFRWFVAWKPGSTWERADPTLNVVNRNRENWRRGIRYAREHPGWFLRTRIRKIADWLTPLSFFVRNHRREVYDGMLAASWVKRPMLVTAVGTTVLVLVFSVPGLFLSMRVPRARLLLGTILVYFLATSLLVSMSRFRLPAEPLLLVLAAGFLADPRSRPGGRERVLVPCVIFWSCLAVFWWIGWPEFIDQFGQAWS